MKFFKAVLLAFVFIGLSQRSWSADAPRVAVLDFTLAQSPGSIDPAVLDFSRAVQAKLLANNDYAWVERQEFDRISREVDLGGNSRTDAATAVRLGHLLRADLMLRGEITPRSAGVSDLTVEVIDLKKADVLASKVFPLTSSAQKQPHPTAAEVETTSRGAVEVLQDATKRLQQMNALRVLAPLYFKNTGKSDRLVFLEERLKKVFDDEATPGTGFRVLHFPRLGEAGTESSLVLSGLTDTDANAWQHIADAYIWGTFSEEGHDGVVFEEVPVTITLALWSGAGNPREIKWTGAVKELEKGLHELTSQVLAAAKSGVGGGESKGNERQQLAANLAQRAADVARQIRENQVDAKTPTSAYLESTAGRQQYAYWLRLLDVACFFDPMNRTLQKERLQVAWSRSNPFKPAATVQGRWLRIADFQLQAQRFKRLPDGKLDPFWPKSQSEHLAEAVDFMREARWDGHAFIVPQVELHRQLRNAAGQWSQLVVQTGEEVKQETVKPAWYETQRSAWFEQASVFRNVSDPIIVRDVLEQIWPVLEGEFGRALHATGSGRREAERWTEVFFSVYESFADSSRPTAMLDSAWKSYQPVEPPRPVPNKVNGKPASAVSPRPEPPWAPWVSPIPPPMPPQAKDPSIPVLAAGIREIDPRAVTTYERTSGKDDLLLRKRRGVNLSVNALAFESGKLWFTEENEELAPALGARNPLGAHYVWSYDPALRTSELITAKLGAHPAVRNLASFGGAMWLGLDGDGVWRFDPENSAIKRFKGEDGLQTSRILSATTDHDQLYFLGGITPGFFISKYSPKENKWSGIACPVPEDVAASAKRAVAMGAAIELRIEPHLAVYGDWICFNSDWISFFNQSTGKWVDLLAGQQAATTFSLYRSFCCSADETGFWLGSGDTRSGSVRFLDPNAPANTRSIKVPGLPVAMAHHGPWLWVVLDHPEALSCLGLIDKRSGTFVGQIVLPGQHMGCLVATDNRIWVGGNKRVVRSGLWEDGSALLEVVLQEPRSDGAGSKTLPSSSFPLLRAVGNGDAAAVDMLLGQHQNANESASSGWTPLMAAAASGRLDLATRLLAAGANPNLLSKEGDSALQQAALRNDLPFAKLLLDHGTNPNLHSLVKVRGMLPIRRPVGPVFDLSPPTQPAGLKARVNADGEVELSWEDRSSDEMQFDIFYQNRLVESVPANVTHWLDFDVRTERELEYTVQARNHASKSFALDDCPKVKILRPEVSSRIIRLPYGLFPGGTGVFSPAVASQSPLSTAAGAGYSEMVTLLLASGADPNIEDALGSTPVINAARHRQYGVVRQLVAAKADPVLRAESGETAVSLVYRWHEDQTMLKELLAAVPAAPRIAETSTLLMDAAERGQVKDIEMLASLGGDAGACDTLGQSPLSRALALKRYDAALSLLKSQGAKLKERWQRPQNQESDREIIEAAASADSPELLALLLEAGLNVNRKTSGKPMAVIAAENGAFAGLEFLLAHGADASAKDYNGKAVKDYLTEEQAQFYLRAAQVPESKSSWPPPLSRSLMKAGPVQYELKSDPARATANEALLAACKVGDLSAATRAMESHAEVDCYDTDGRTPLTLAIAARAVNLARWLVEEGAYVNRPTRKGYSPLAFALQTHDPEFIDYLMRAGADLNLQAEVAYTPLTYAALKGDLPAIRQLLDAGADPNISVYDRGRWLSPLVVALKQGNTEAVDLLLARKANPRAQICFIVRYDNNDFRKELQPSLLMGAAFGHNLALIKRMISLGQDPAFKTYEGYDALSWAASAGSREAVEFLLPLSSRKGKAIRNALEENHPDIVDLLQKAGYQSE